LVTSARVFSLYRSRLHIAVIGNFIFIDIRNCCDRAGAFHPGCFCLTFSTQSTGTRSGRRIFIQGQLEDSSMTFRPNEAAIDEIVASCNGDVQGALKALLLVNEHLEAELARLYAVITGVRGVERGGGALH
jgi:hypothetical protein